MTLNTVLARDPHQFDYEIEGPRNSQLWDKRYLLFLQDVTAVFDGFTALNIKDLGIGHNELRVVVGPNGAGKTTMCDVISGLTRPSTGQVYFDSEVITGESEAEIAQRGVGRKFQIPNVFDSLSVWQNMLLALPRPASDRMAIIKRLMQIDHQLQGPLPIGMIRLWDFLGHTGGRVNNETKDQIHELLERVNLIDDLNTEARYLSHGQRQWLAISSLILKAPKLLLVDEPAAGLTDIETELTAELLLELKNKHTLIVIEHDMEFVRQLDSRVTVLNEGQILAEGTLDEVQQNEEVIEAYLGR